MTLYPGQCPPVEVWAEFPNHVGDELRAQLRGHLVECDECRQLVSELLRHAGSMLDSEPEPELGGDGGDPLEELPERDEASYVIEREYGRGGLGRVYAVRDRRLGRTIAVKELLTDRPDLNRRFAREARITSRLEHPGIVPVYEAGTWRDGKPYYAMKLVRGPSLLDVLRTRERFAERVPLVANVLAVADAVAYAHSRGVIHRDLKPANVILGAYGETIVIDWGLAKEVGGADIAGPDDAGAASGDDVTVAGAVLGTPAYMAPEQARGEEVDQRADVYALGAILYHVITGEAPPPANAGEPLRLPAQPPVRADLAAIVHKALAADRGDRYADAGELRQDLQRYQDGQLVSAHTYPLHQRARRFLGRHARGLSIAAVAIAALGAAASYGYRRHVENQAIAHCEATSDAMDDVWNPSVRDSIAGAASAAFADKVSPWFDSQAESWKRDARAACMASSVRRRWDERRAAKASWCLEDRRLQMSSLIARLSDPKLAVTQAVRAASGLAPTGDCIDERALTGMADAPAPAVRPEVETIRRLVAEAESMEVTGQYEAGLERIARAEPLADELAIPSVLATVHERKASLLHEAGKYDEGAALARRAYMEAATSETWDVAASVATELIYYTGLSLSHPDEGRIWAELARVAISLAGDPLELREAGRLVNLTALLGSSGDHIGARDAAEACLAIRERVLGPNHPDVATALNNAGNAHQTAGDYARAEKYFRRSFALKARYLGEDHPSTASTLENVGTALMYQNKLDEAERTLERGLALREAALGADHPGVANSLVNLGTVELAIDKPARALTMFERALAIQTRTFEDGHLYFAYTHQGIGEALRMLGQLARARAELEQAMSISDAPGSPPDIRARIRLSLAETLWDAPGAGPRERGRAVTLAREGVALLVESGAEPDLRDRIDAWLGGHSM